MDWDDRELMQRVQAGQLSLFDELVRRYRGPLHRVAADKLGDAGRAEDVVQETFLAVFAARHTYKPQFAFRTWLWTILLNLCRRELSKRKRRSREVLNSTLSASSQGFSEIPGNRSPRAEPSTTETGLTRILQRERKQQLLDQLAKLPEVQADAIRLRFFGELKYGEIAEAMGCREITAKVRVRNGLATLSRLLRDTMGEVP